MDVAEAIYVVNHEWELPESHVDAAWRSLANHNQQHAARLEAQHGEEIA